MKDKRCPFCCSMQLSWWESMTSIAIECRRCGAIGPVALTEDEATLWWNEAPRPHSTKIMKQRGRYKSRVQSMRRQLARERAEAEAAREQIEAPKRAQDREYAIWASEREAWLRSPVDKDTAQ